MTLRNRLKAGIEHGCVRAGLPAFARLARRHDVLILAYHNVVPDHLAGRCDPLLHVPRSCFAEQLDLLVETHEVVSLGSALSDPTARRRRPRAAITFDDAYRGAVTIGIEEAAARGLPTTIFVAPAYLGGRCFWWDVFAPDGERARGATFRERALEECRGMEDAVRRWAENNGVEGRSMPSECGCASEEELHAAVARPGVSLGTHTWSHPNLRRLSLEELRVELGRPLVWLRDHFLPVVPIVAYPYGLSSSTVEHVAAAVGHRAGLLVDGGWMSHRRCRPYAIPRASIPAGLSADGFRLRTAWPIGL
jgi:peptidoglycan/xylan/chitin deacetylase (PgdA/CDA1 family)